MEQQSEKKEWKWPLGIFVGYMIFVAATLSFVFFTFTQRTDLVVENYYEKTLTFQEQIDRAGNNLSLENPFRAEQNDTSVDLFFPPELLYEGFSGEINLYRPSDSRMDKSLPVSTDDSGHQMLSLDSFTPGLWKMQVTWTSGDTEYYAESNLYIR